MCKIIRMKNHQKSVRIWVVVVAERIVVVAVVDCMRVVVVVVDRIGMVVAERMRMVVVVVGRLNNPSLVAWDWHES